MLTGLSAAVTSVTADLGTVGAALVTIAIVGLGIRAVLRRLG